MKSVLLVLCVVVYVSGGPVSPSETVVHAVVDNLVKCNSDLSLCLKEQALKAADRLGAARKLKITDSITLFNSNPKEAKSLELLPEDPILRNKEVTAKLWEKTSELLQSSELELSYGTDEEAESRSMEDEVEESRGKKKKKEIKKKIKMLIPLILIAKAKAIALAVISLVVIAASLFKIALIAKIAFIVKLIALIKSLLAKKHGGEEVSYEPHGGWDSGPSHHPVAEHGHGWESQGWSRSRNEANNLAYSAYAN